MSEEVLDEEVDRLPADGGVRLRGIPILHYVDVLRRSTVHEELRWGYRLLLIVALRTNAFLIGIGQVGFDLLVGLIGRTLILIMEIAMRGYVGTFHHGIHELIE